MRAVELHSAEDGAKLNQLPHAALVSLVELFKANRHQELEATALGLLAQYPGSAQLLHLVGVSRLSRGLNERALEVLGAANRFTPNDPEIENLLGVVLFRLGRHEEARAYFEDSLSRDGRSYETLVNASANAMVMNDAAAAAEFANRALALQPNGVAALFSSANARAAGGRNDEAVELYARAIALEPRSADLYMNLGGALTRLGRLSEAASALEQALALRPEHAPTHLNLGRALHDLGQSASAQRHFRAASHLDPKMIEAHSAYLFSLAHDERVSPQQAFQEHLRIGDLIESPLRSQWREHENDRDPDRELRIGFVSGDMYDHPVANLIEPVWRAMKGGWTRILVYSNSALRDSVTEQLQALVDAWVQVERMSDEALFDRIRGDGIDILVDLSGHTARNRLPVFARKPAPIQVTAIGYPGTTGLSAMDYRLWRRTDSTKAELQSLFAEKLVYTNFRGFRPAPDAPDVGPLPALDKGWITFASFNRPSKLSDGTIALWSRVLSAIPTARMLIAGVGEARLAERLQSSFAALGVDRQRLDFRPRVPMREYLALHNDVDIALDTFPYSGGTTSGHSLFMGVPVLTLAGESPQQVHTAMRLRTLGLVNWIGETEDDFVSKACQAAADLSALGRLRASLRSLASQHYEGSLEESARQMEAAFRTMWRRWCARQAPASFTVDV